jgi:carboxymethylenebutenolidase
MTNWVSFQSRSGGDVSGAMAEPAGGEKTPAPAIVLLQEFWGVTEHIKSLVERFAKEGFLVLAPDLYHGKVTSDPAEGAKLAGALDTLKAVDEIAGAVAFLKAHPRSNGKVGVTGFCLGGALAIASGCHVPGLGAVVSFYGIPPADKVDYAKLTAPVMMHVAKHDHWVTTEKASHVRDAIEKHGPHVDLFIYAANHAFVNDTLPDSYSPDNAQVALERTVEFFKQHLS